MMRKILVVILTLSQYSQSISQVLTARIIDRDTKHPIEYVNVGIVGKNKGTVSDKDGWFSLEIESHYNLDTLRISSIGYQSVSFLVENFRSVFTQTNGQLIVEMNKKIPILTEVVVAPREMKRKLIGNKGRLIAVEFKSSQDTSLGQELGTLMKIKKSPVFIQDVNFVIKANTYNDSILCRINIYDMNKGFPGENILKEPIIASIKIKKGIFTVDLRSYNIHVDNDFVVTLEWISEAGNKEISFGLGTKSKSFMRVASEAEWEKFPLGFGIGIYTTVLYIK